MVGAYTLVVSVIVGYVAYKNGLFCYKDIVPQLEEKWWGPGDSREEDTSIRPFKIEIPDKFLQDLNQRLTNTRFSTISLEGAYFHYGFNSETLEKVVNYWKHNYHWKEREVFLNRYPHFKTNIQGLDIHFVHVKPKENSKATKIPLMLLHGWPGSVREFYSLMERLDAEDLSFEIIAPSLPGFGWSQGSAKKGLGPVQMAQILAKLMTRLGHDKWFVQGGDWGSQIASHMGLLYPDKVRGIHLNLCMVDTFKTNLYTFLAAIHPSWFMEERFVKRLYPVWQRFGDKLLETGYLHIQATKPDTIGAALADSPAGLAAYILEKFSTATNGEYRGLQDGGLTEKFTYTDLLDNIMIYWVTNSMTTAMRIYAEHFSNEHRALGFESLPVTVPTWCARFPGEISYLPDWILRRRYPNLVRATDMETGGHFAAMELPDVLAKDIQEAVRSFLKL